MKFSHLRVSPKEELEFNKYIGLVGKNLERFDMRGKDLSGVNFTNANCRAADFSKANLDGAVFVKADLSRSCFYETSCKGADFSGADMTMIYARGADFSNARLVGAIMRMSFIKYANFTGADMSLADVLCAFAVWSNLKDQELKHTFNADKLIKDIYMREDMRGKPKYEDGPGLVKMSEGTYEPSISIRANAARERVEEKRVELMPPYVTDVTMAEWEKT